MREEFAARTTFSTADARLKIKRQTFADGSEKTTLTGYPILWNATSSDRGGYVVRIAPNAALFTDSVLALWHHQFDKPLAGTVNQTLRIGAADETGIPVEIDLDTNTTAGSDALAYVSSKLVGGMSFSMANGFEDYDETDDDGYGRVINVKKFTCDEVTITPIPAFSDTKIGVKLDAEAVKPQEPQPHEEPAPQGTPPVAGGMADAAPNRIAAANKLRAIRLDLLK